MINLTHFLYEICLIGCCHYIIRLIWWFKYRQCKDDVHEFFSFPNMNSEEENRVIIVSALNLIKRKQYKKHKNFQKKIYIWKKIWLLYRSPYTCTTLHFSSWEDIFKIFNKKPFTYFWQHVEINFEALFDKIFP